MEKLSETKKSEEPKNLILFDWLTFTIRQMEVDKVVRLLGLEPAQFKDMAHGLNGYPTGIHFDGISVLSGASAEMGVCVNMSGTGCRTWESHTTSDWDQLFCYLRRCESIVNITRLDVAFDDHTGIVSLPGIRYATEDGNYVSKWKHWDITIGSGGELTVYFGSRSSDVMLRMYDKAIERGYDDGRHWIRLELQLRDERAKNMIDAMYAATIGVAFRGVLVNYLRFLIPDSKDSNKSRWHTSVSWEELIQNVERISIWDSPGTEYNAQQLEHFVLDQAGNAIRTYIKLYGHVKFAAKLRDLDKPLPKKYAKLLSDAGYDPLEV